MAALLTTHWLVPLPRRRKSKISKKTVSSVGMYIFICIFYSKKMSLKEFLQFSVLYLRLTKVQQIIPLEYGNARSVSNTEL